MNDAIAASPARIVERVPAVVRRFLGEPEYWRARSAAGWLAALLAATVGYAHLVSSALDGRRTLGGLSWVVRGLIEFGRATNGLFTAYGLHLAAAIAACAVATFFLVEQGRQRRRQVAACLASAASVASIWCMAQKQPGAAAALALVAAALLVVPERSGEEQDSALHGWSVFVPLGVGFILRFWALAEYPRGFAQHAVEHHKGSLAFYETLTGSAHVVNPQSALGVWELFGEQWGPMSMVDGLGFVVFGVGMVQSRLVQAVLGCLAIWAAYALGSCLGGRRLAFVFSLLLAVSPWHIAFSRYGDAEHALPILQALLAILFLFRALRHGRAGDYALAGVTLSLSLYVYATNQILPFVAAGYLVYKLLSSPGLWVRDRIKLLYMAATAVVVSIPHVLTRGTEGDLWLLRTPPGEFNPLGIADIDAWRMVGEQLFVQIEESWFFRVGGGLGPTVQAMSIIGAVLCVAALFSRRRRDESVLLLLWLALSFLPGVFAQIVQFRRLLLVLVVALMLAAIGIVRILQLFESGGISKRASRVVVVSLCIVGTAVSAFFYFEEVRVEECNLHVGHTETALFVRGSIGEKFVYVFAEEDMDRWTIDDYIILFAYQEIANSGRRGLVLSDLLGIVGPSELADVLRRDRLLNRKVQLVASNDDAGEWNDPSSLRSRMTRHDLAPRRCGDLVVWDWRNSAEAAQYEVASGGQRVLEVDEDDGLDEGPDWKRGS